MLSVIAAYIQVRLHTERGQDLIEYALLGGLVAIAITGAVLVLSGAVSSMGDGIGRCIDFESSTTCAPF